jgi:flagellar biosynthetic protein FlhB
VRWATSGKSVMAEDLGERTEAPTPKRRQEARDEGNVAKSLDLSGALTLLCATLIVWAFAMTMFWSGRDLLDNALRDDAIGSPISVGGAWEATSALGLAALRLAAPVLMLAWLAAFGSQFVQVGWLFVPKGLQPNPNKVNPLNGFKRIFGLSGLVKSGLDAVKVAIVLVIATITAISYAPEIVVLSYLSSAQALREVGLMMLDLAMRVLAVLVTLGVIDYAYQKWKHTRDLRMTRQQVKDEMKESEGDPETKRRRLRIQRQIAMQRISAAVPKADVIVTNPEHISIAIQYDSTKMHAPRVVAKGADHLALRIRVIALQHNIPIVERKPLARALYKQVQVNQEIPAEFYKAVAEILAYVYRLSGRKVA